MSSEQPSLPPGQDAAKLAEIEARLARDWCEMVPSDIRYLLRVAKRQRELLNECAEALDLSLTCGFDRVMPRWLVRLSGDLYPVPSIKVAIRELLEEIRHGN